MLICIMIIVLAVFIMYLSNSRKTEVLYDDGEFCLKVFDNLLTPEECETIVRHAMSNMKPSYVVDFDGKHIHYKSRNSNSTFISSLELQVAHRIDTFAHNFTGLPISHLEDLQVVHYEPGGYFNAHFDNDNKNKHSIESTRSHTLLVYLNTIPEGSGGETEFPELGIRVRPVKGKGLFWNNLDANGCILAKSLHAGKPVAPGYIKLVANKWVHNRSLYRY